MAQMNVARHSLFNGVAFLCGNRFAMLLKLRRALMLTGCGWAILPKGKAVESK